MIKQRILNRLLKGLFPVFSADKVLTASKSGHLFLGEKLIDEKRKQSLKAQVRMLRNTEIWEILTTSLKDQAQRTMFNESKDLQDLMNGKMILYTVSVMENIIKKVEDSK